MEHTPQSISELLKSTAISLTQGKWPEFLRTAAWNYKYDFPSQVLIFAQNPSATACAPESIWINRFQRTPNRAAAIALLSEQGGLRHVFDIADTTVHTDAKAPDVPLWTVTPELEPAIRHSLIQSFLPVQRQSSELYNAPAPAFYRVIANSIVESHCQNLLQDLQTVRKSCSLKNLDSWECKNTLRGILAESLAAILQYRCGLAVQLYEPSIAALKQFDSPRAMLVLGSALQKIAHLALQNVAYSVKKTIPDQIPVPNKSLPDEVLTQPEAGQSASCLRISQEDIDRALIEGPSLPGGKFRLYRAATDPTATVDTLSDALRAEYNGINRPFMSSCGLHGTVSCGSEGLIFALNSLQEGNHLTLPWKTASRCLKTLINANSYLSPSDKINITAYFSAQESLEARQKTGAVLTVFFTAYESNRQSLYQTQERIRAYVYENSDRARQELITQLHHLMEQENITNDPQARELFHTITAELTHDTLIDHNPEIHSAGKEGWLHPAETCDDPKDSNQVLPRRDNLTEKTSTRSPEPFIDHPELRRVDRSMTTRSDKAALTDLLLHFVTYRSTFCRFAPALSEQDQAYREEEFLQMDNMLVSSNVEENRKNIRTAKEIISRWFLPFEEVRPDILVQQDQIIAAAETVLQTPPKQNIEPAHIHRHIHEHDYVHRHTEPVAAQGVAGPDENTLFDFTSDNTPSFTVVNNSQSVSNLTQENQPKQSNEFRSIQPVNPRPLAEQIELAQSRTNISSTKIETEKSFCRV